MKFRCERDELLGAVQFASRAISTRATLPVLAGLRIEAGDTERVRVAATDLELTMETSFLAAVDEPGRAIVPGRLFGEMTRNLVAGQVSVAATESEIEIGSGRGQFRVKTLAPDDYPALPIENGEAKGPAVEVELERDSLATALSQVVRAASTDESRQVLTGVLWELSEGSLTLAATDSYRLGVRTLDVGGGSKETRLVVLPARTLAELGRALQGAGNVRALVKENLVSFTIDGTEETGSEQAIIGSRFIEGEFPKYRQLLPEKYPNALLVERDALLDVIKRVGLLAQNNLPVKLRLGDELEVSAHTPDVGEGQEVLDAEYSGEPLVIAFNPQFLHDGVSAVQGDRVLIEVGDGLKPAILKNEGDSSFTYLLMPVRLS
jgi:DNA polymerase III subunit beta